jgi:nucleotide-binding universal stress UspA family protein
MTMTPPPPAPVVLAADGTASSAGALRYAVQEAVARRTGLRIVHVCPMVTATVPIRPTPGVLPSIPSELSAHGGHVLERTVEEARSLAPGLVLSTLLAHGARVGAITDAASDAQLVVVGRETRTGAERVLTGTTTAGVASRARCPVVVVPGSWEAKDGTEPGGTVLVGIRTDADAADLMTVAHDWWALHGAAITVVHAWELPDPVIDGFEGGSHVENGQVRGQRLLDRALAVWRHQHSDVPLETRVVRGHPAPVLAAAAEAADLVLVRRAHEHRPFDHLGGTVRALLLACRAPVEVVPTDLARLSAGDLVLEESGHLAR